MCWVGASAFSAFSVKLCYGGAFADAPAKGTFLMLKIAASKIYAVVRLQVEFHNANDIFKVQG